MAAVALAVGAGMSEEPGIEPGGSTGGPLAVGLFGLLDEDDGEPRSSDLNWDQRLSKLGLSGGSGPSGFTIGLPACKGGGAFSRGLPGVRG